MCSSDLPCCGVLRVCHLLQGEGVEVGVAEVVAAVHVGSAESFGDDVDLGGAAIFCFCASGSKPGEIVAGEDVENLDEDDAAGGGRRSCDDVVAAVLSFDGLAIFDLVGGEVFGGDEAAAGFFDVGDLVGHRAFVELVGVFGDADEGGGELGLPEGIAFFIEVAVTLIDVSRCREERHVLALQHARFCIGEDEAFGGEFDGGSHVLGEGELAEMALRVDHASD